MREYRSDSRCVAGPEARGAYRVEVGVSYVRGPYHNGGRFKVVWA